MGKQDKPYAWMHVCPCFWAFSTVCPFDTADTPSITAAPVSSQATWRVNLSNEQRFHARTVLLVVSSSFFSSSAQFVVSWLLHHVDLIFECVVASDDHLVAPAGLSRAVSAPLQCHCNDCRFTNCLSHTMYKVAVHHIRCSTSCPTMSFIASLAT